MSKFISFLAPLIEAYIFYQKSSNRWSESSYVKIVSFDRYCKKQYPKADDLTQEMVNSWCSKRDTETNKSCYSRIYPVINFIRYLRNRSKTEVCDPIIPRSELSTYIPHTFTEVELKNFFTACDEITTKPKPRSKEQTSRRITVPVFFRLLYSSGIRTCEARKLRTEEVDLDQGILNIRNSKGHNQHYVVLHDSMLVLLKQYNSVISKQYPNRSYFFPAGKNSFHTGRWIFRNFRELWDKYNTSYAIAYDLRHNYAIENINSWLNCGLDFNANLLYLSKSMGHSSVESTKYYYSLVPALADILEAQTDDSIIPEVDHESL